NLDVSGNRSLGGELHLTNSHGTLLVNLERGTLVKNSKGEQLKVVMIVGSCTGAYTAVEGNAGTATFQLTKTKSLTNASNNGNTTHSMWNARAVDLALFMSSGELKADEALEWGPY